MIERTVEEMYRDDEANEFLEVTYQNGDKEVLYFKDFSSGAMIENIVRRAKKLAIKRVLAGGPKGIPPTTSCSRSTRSSRSTRTCPTPRTPTTGRRSPARRASGSSTSARSSSATTTARPPAAGPSNGSPRASTCNSRSLRRVLRLRSLCLRLRSGRLRRDAESAPPDLTEPSLTAGRHPAAAGPDSLRHRHRPALGQDRAGR